MTVLLAAMIFVSHTLAWDHPHCVASNGTTVFEIGNGRTGEVVAAWPTRRGGTCTAAIPASAKPGDPLSVRACVAGRPSDDPSRCSGWSSPTAAQ